MVGWSDGGVMVEENGQKWGVFGVWVEENFCGWNYHFSMILKIKIRCVKICIIFMHFTVIFLCFCNFSTVFPQFSTKNILFLKTSFFCTAYAPTLPQKSIKK